MIKLQIRYQTEEEKQKMIDILSAGAVISKVSRPYRQGKYYRVYVDVK